jgi:restriction endonuclease S subunit
MKHKQSNTFEQLYTKSDQQIAKLDQLIEKLEQLLNSLQERLAGNCLEDTGTVTSMYTHVEKYADRHILGCITYINNKEPLIDIRVLRTDWIDICF